jgi:NADH dehydrogenase [ubiquinone] 1 alpha subcomplex assembly factor 7
MPAKQKKLRSLIAGRALQQGALPVADYMALVLGHPEDGYYMAGNPFGAAGDFTTAPEISQMFGEMIGAWLVDLWLQMGRPEKVNLVELGPGRGTLASDILRTLSVWPDFREAVTLHLVENSPKLREVQAKALKGYSVEWHDSFGDVPDGFCFVVANEFFDALPVYQFIKELDGWKERRIGYDVEKDIFYFTAAPLDLDIDSIMPEEFLQAPEGSIFEISPASMSIVEDIAKKIAAQGGSALLIDYGHASPGLGDTLQAVSRHQYADPLQNPGANDITAHVDFGTLKTVAEPWVQVSGPVTQGQFLSGVGIHVRAERLCEAAGERQKRDIMSGLDRLVSPDKMGRLFKVMAFTPKGSIITVTGFSDEVSDNRPE